MNQPASLLPQCGCDNITYWNETIAGGFGANIKAPGACPAGTAAPCKIAPGGTKCPDGRDCNVDVMQCTIPSGTAGVCWGLPKACPAGDAKYRACPPAGGANQCLSLCEAVSSERSYARDALVCP